MFIYIIALLIIVQSDISHTKFERQSLTNYFDHLIFLLKISLKWI